MKKLYRKGTVHPSPSVVSDHLLSFLPAAILTLTVALSPADKEVLAYLISCSSNNHRPSSAKPTAASPSGGSKSGDDHPACFNCNCFRCYTSYWKKWNESPNRQLIDEIIDAFEDSLLKKNNNKKEKNKRERRKCKTVKINDSPVLDDEAKKSEVCVTVDIFNFSEASEADVGVGESGGGEVGDDNVEVAELEKGSVRRFVGFLGDKIWSVWGRRTEVD